MTLLLAQAGVEELCVWAQSVPAGCVVAGEEVEERGWLQPLAVEAVELALPAVRLGGGLEIDLPARLSARGGLCGFGWGKPEADGRAERPACPSLPCV